MKKYSTATVIMDGMIKDYNSIGYSMSEFSRKGTKKGSKDTSILFATLRNLGSHWLHARIPATISIHRTLKIS